MIDVFGVFLSASLVMGGMLLTMAFIFAIVSILPFPRSPHNHGKHSRKHPRR